MSESLLEEQRTTNALEELTQGDITPQSDFNVSEPYGKIVYRGDIPEPWVRTINKNLSWYEEDGKLNIKYYRGKLQTTWGEIEKIIPLKDPSIRKNAIEGLLGKNVTCNTKTAVSIFSKLVADGAIRRRV